MNGLEQSKTQSSVTRDFSFQIPDGWTDRTMIAWSAPQAPGQKVVPNVLVAYDALRKDEDLAGYVNRQLKELMAKAKKFQLDLRQDTKLAGREAVDVIFEWDSGSGMLKQRQVYSMLPDGRAVTLVFTSAVADFPKMEPQFLIALNSFGWSTSA